MKLKVYGCGWLGNKRRVVAASNQKDAAALIGTSLSYLRTHGSVTGNEEEVNLAMQNPGTVWERLDNYRTGPDAQWKIVREPQAKQREA